MEHNQLADLVSNHVAGDLGKRILRTRWDDTWKVATDGTKEPKSSLVVRRDQEEKSLFLEKFAPTASKTACIFFTTYHEIKYLGTNDD